MTPDMERFKEAFLIEADEHAEEFELTLLNLENEPEDHELLNTIFRSAHSIKGGAATFGLPTVAKFTHEVESLLDEVRNGHITLTPPLIRLLFESLDRIRILLAHEKGLESEPVPEDDLADRVRAATAHKGVIEAEPVAAIVSTSSGEKRYSFLYSPPEDVLRRGCDPLLPLIELGEIAHIESIRCDTSRLPEIQSLVTDSCYLSWEGTFTTSCSIAEIYEVFEFVVDAEDLNLKEIASDVSAVQAPATKAAGAQPATEHVRATKHDVGMLRVPADKIDRLVDLVGELVISQSILNETVQGFNMSRLPALVDAVASIEQSCRELQERVMAVRLVPLGQAFGRFPRMVRDLSASRGKQVELSTSGEETELDKSLVEAIVDPLTHLVRNSLDHGLETPEDRIAKGKSPSGHISLAASHDGGSVMIEVTDDGRGLDRKRILEKAVERGLVDGQAQLSDEAVHALIFHPGFSTASEVTDVSGRGVGMDIVRSTVESLNGSVTLTTKPGEGTSFRIRLPLTMAILEGLSLRVGDEIYVLPLTSIVESIRPRREDLTCVTGHTEVVRVRGDVLPIVRLHKVFGAIKYISDPCEALLVIVENESQTVALLVDELIGQSQVVIKNMEANYRKVEGVAGATIMGDGRVALILDVAQLIRGIDATTCAA